MLSKNEGMILIFKIENHITLILILPNLYILTILLLQTHLHLSEFSLCFMYPLHDLRHSFCVGDTL